MSRNGYLERRQSTINAYRQAEKETYMQYMVDLFMIALNDPDVMGSGVLGKKRLMRVVEAVSKAFDEYALALTSDPEADYWQDKLDKRLEAIIGKEEMQPFLKRYEWIAPRKYGPRSK